jgi:redox-sensitive bicupin YhaK (pirin superfamily)
MANSNIESLGHGATLGPDELQRITAGTGLTHSEFNPHPTQPVHLYQIWLFPQRKGLTPSWEQKKLPIHSGAWTLAASPEGADGSLTVRQDVRLWIGRFSAGDTLEMPLAPGRHAWIQVTRGSVELQDTPLQAGDGVALSDQPTVRLTSANGGEVLLFDLA